VATSRGNRARWAIGLGVAGIAIAVAIGAILLLGTSPMPEALKYIPGDAAVVAEVRLDLPGDQLQHLGNLLANFPGFRDQSTLPDKIDEALSQLVGAASSGSVDYRTDLKPWLNGPAFIGMRSPDQAGAGGETSGQIVSATTNGAVDCTAALEGTVTHETYRGLDLVIAADGGLACVVDGRQALLGEPATVRTALDAKANGTGMDKNERYRAARAALTGDRLATLFVNGDAIEGLMPVPSFGDIPVPGLGALGGLAGAAPDWTMVGVRAEDTALVVDTVAAPLPAPTDGPTQLPLPGSHPSVLTGMLPANTIVLVEDQGTGVSLQNLLTTLRADPTLGAPLGMLDGLGGAGELVGWIEDAGIAVVNGPTTPTGGVLLVARDDDTAADRVATFNNLVALLGLGGGVEVRETTISGVVVTTVVITDVGAIIPPGTLPGDVEIPTTGPIEFSIAAKGRVILLGVGEGFMTAVLSVQPGASLADQAVYRKAVERSLAGSRTSLYVAVRDVVGLVEGFIPDDMTGEWETDIRPYVAPIEALSISASSDAAANRSRVVITVSQP
jgi:hypothetical protein